MAASALRAGCSTVTELLVASSHRLQCVGWPAVIPARGTCWDYIITGGRPFTGAYIAASEPGYPEWHPLHCNQWVQQPLALAEPAEHQHCLRVCPTNRLVEHLQTTTATWPLPGTYLAHGLQTTGTGQSVWPAPTGPRFPAGIAFVCRRHHPLVAQDIIRPPAATPAHIATACCGLTLKV